MIREKFARIMKESKLSYHEISRRSGVALMTVSGYANLNREPTIEKAVKILKSLGYELELKQISEEE